MRRVRSIPAGCAGQGVGLLVAVGRLTFQTGEVERTPVNAVALIAGVHGLRNEVAGPIDTSPEDERHHLDRRGLEVLGDLDPVPARGYWSPLQGGCHRAELARGGVELLEVRLGQRLRAGGFPGISGLTSRGGRLAGDRLLFNESETVDHSDGLRRVVHQVEEMNLVVGFELFEVTAENLGLKSGRAGGRARAESENEGKKDGGNALFHDGHTLAGVWASAHRECGVHAMGGEAAIQVVSGFMEERQPTRRILGVDWGERRIGLAVSDPLGLVARPLETIERQSDREAARRIAQLAKAEGAGVIVVGLPLEMSGKEAESAARVQRLAGLIAHHSGAEVVLRDERLTSWEADARLRAEGVPLSEAGGRRDAIAAAILVEDYLSEHGCE